MSEITPTRPAWLDDRLYPFTDRYLELEGHVIHYVDEGEGPILLFVHPAPSWSFMFRHYIAALHDRFRCIALDLPGWGLSTARPGFGITIPNLAHVVEAFIERLDLEAVTVWGNDSSGVVGVAAATHVPERIQGFVLSGTFAWSLSSYPKVERYLRLVTGPTFRAVNRRLNLVPRIMGGIALGSRNLSRIERRHYKKAFPTREHRDRVLDVFDALMDHDALAETERHLDVLRDRPVLLVFGEKDATVKFGFYERLQKEFPDHEAHLIPGARHFPFEDTPEAVLRLFESWWQTRIAPALPSRAAGRHERLIRATR